MDKSDIARIYIPDEAMEIAGLWDDFIGAVTKYGKRDSILDALPYEGMALFAQLCREYADESYYEDAHDGD